MNNLQLEQRKHEEATAPRPATADEARLLAIEAISRHFDALRQQTERQYWTTLAVAAGQVIAQPRCLLLSAHNPSSTTPAMVQIGSGLYAPISLSLAPNQVLVNLNYYFVDKLYVVTISNGTPVFFAGEQR